MKEGRKHPSLFSSEAAYMLPAGICLKLFSKGIKRKRHRLPKGEMETGSLTFHHFLAHPPCPACLLKRLTLSLSPHTHPAEALCLRGAPPEKHQVETIVWTQDWAHPAIPRSHKAALSMQCLPSRGTRAEPHLCLLLRWLRNTVQSQACMSTCSHFPQKGHYNQDITDIPAFHPVLERKLYEPLTNRSPGKLYVSGLLLYKLVFHILSPTRADYQ